MGPAVPGNKGVTLMRTSGLRRGHAHGLVAASAAERFAKVFTRFMGPAEPSNEGATSMRNTGLRRGHAPAPASLPRRPSFTTKSFRYDSLHERYAFSNPERSSKLRIDGKRLPEADGWFPGSIHIGLGGAHGQSVAFMQA